jgi:hypothetical protein
MTHICFVSMTVYPVLHGDTDLQGIGGAELQQVQIARLLLRMGHQVSFVTVDHGQPDGEVLQGCRVYKAYQPHCRSAGSALFLPALDRDLACAQARQCRHLLHPCRWIHAGHAGAVAWRPPLRFVYAAASRFRFQPDKVALQFARDRWLFRFGLRRADAVIVQTEVQRDC